MAPLDVERDGPFLFGGHMQDTRPLRIIEALDLTRRDMDLEKDLDVLDYNYKNARSHILNEQSKIQMRIGELRRTEGLQLLRGKGA